MYRVEVGTLSGGEVTAGLLGGGPCGAFGNVRRIPVDPPSTHGRPQGPPLLSSPLPLSQRGSPPLRNTRSLLKNALVEGCQELHVGAGFGHMLQQGFHGFQAALVGQRGEHAAHDDDGTQGLIVKQQLFAAGAGQ
jgi:hypothetical protein